MAKKEKSSAPAPEAPVAQEDRVDVFAQDMFKSLGFSGRLPDSMVEIYNHIKRRKDKVQPGRLSPEGFATVIFLSEMIDGIVFPPKADAPADDGKGE